MNTKPRANTVDIPYMQDSCSYFERLRHLPYPVLLDSNAQASAGRFDIITASPASIIISKTNADNDALFTQINKDISSYTTNGAQHLSAPFVSGAIGIFSYDIGMQLNGLGSDLNPDSETDTNAPWPMLIVGVYQWAIVQDHQQQQSWLLSDPKQDKTITDGLLSLISHQQENADTEPFNLTTAWQASADIKSYNALFNSAMNYIEQGDCYQVNVAQQMSAEYKGDSWQAYKQLRHTSPTPFAAYFEAPQGCLMSLSPERFIQVKDQQVQTQPIKGTRKRGATAEEDSALIAELSSSEKDRAENLMIVDLMRNDLGKCCQQGSIKVPKLFEVESHPNVHHLVSTVTAKLPQAGVSNALDLLKSSLPGGSVTGAPKKRAMEIIDELESFSRSIYCGSVAYIDNSGNMDSNILIRSLLLSKTDNEKTGTVQCWGGGGIVADSKAELEYEESLQKIRNILDALSHTR